MPAGFAATTGLESVFEDMYAAELYDLRVFEANRALGRFEPLGIQEPSNIVREDEEYRLSIRIRFTGPLHFAITPNRIVARFFLEGMGFSAQEVDIPEVTIVSNALEVQLVTPPLPARRLRVNRVYKVAAAVEVENEYNRSTRMSGYLEGATLHIREQAQPKTPTAEGEPIPN